jgi:hypothetical protein
METALVQECAICRHLGLDPRATVSSLGLRTAISGLIEASTARFDDGRDSEAHVLVPVCPEHVVDIYRGRVAGMSMAWRMAAVPAK